MSSQRTKTFFIPYSAEVFKKRLFVCQNVMEYCRYGRNGGFYGRHFGLKNPGSFELPGFFVLPTKAVPFLNPREKAGIELGGRQWVCSQVMEACNNFRAYSSLWEPNVSSLLMYP